MYPGIPEYFNFRGRGMYPYLTGSASWYILTMVTEVFGVKGRLGDLELSPKLVRSQFDRRGEASINTIFAGQHIEITYHNSDRLGWDEYQVKVIKIDGKPVSFEPAGAGAILARQVILKLSTDQIHNIDVTLAKRDEHGPSSTT
jgi:cellobiose phosphorylase